MLFLKKLAIRLIGSHVVGWLEASVRLMVCWASALPAPAASVAATAAVANDRANTLFMPVSCRTSMESVTQAQLRLRADPERMQR